MYCNNIDVLQTVASCSNTQTLLMNWTLILFYNVQYKIVLSVSCLSSSTLYLYSYGHAYTLMLAVAINCVNVVGQSVHSLQGDDQFHITVIITIAVVVPHNSYLYKSICKI